MSTLGIKDIAKLAGVSPATVSRVLNTPELISAKTLVRVQNIIDEHGYIPNRLGTSLRTKKSGNIVAIIPHITKPVNAGIIKSIEQEAQKFGYSVLLGDTQGLRERELHYGSMVRNGQADGILLFGSHLPFAIKTDIPLEKQLPPIVNANEMVPEVNINKIFIDNEAAAMEAMQHLFDLGHTRIAAVAGPSDIPSSDERISGYKKALVRQGIELDENLIVQGDYTLHSGVDMAYYLLSLESKPTAIFAFSDDMAIGIMQVLHKNGVVVPDDISVMGFDDINYAEFVRPSLTTVHQPLEEIGQACANLLIRKIKNPDLPAEKIQLDYTLRIRESTGPAAK
ncbi:LacI family transcriptional regulator [Paraglaciecola aquimarina]|uniref:LacI family transcriptional regulator n=1 Tax=Paraglaciecola algarum TaxID=3050085 RepID=A0ABS9D2M3_9ALTE|nr:LacI family DNA-binding transcriptional regulator [Paraglaciecola sp. G1-23]MCF2946727.1 LacI family transcriptional regulator [Paraglaciecola sp. G1-23]